MLLDMRVDAWRGETRLARDLPVEGWSWSEKHGAMPCGRLTVEFTADQWPATMLDPLWPMGQTLRCEILHEDRVVALPPARILETSEGVSVSADTIDLSIVEDPWPFPSSPATGAGLLQEATRLADPVRVRLGIPDVGLPEGLAWSGDRDKALLELAASRSCRWQLDADGWLTLVPLGNVADPHRTYTAREITAAPRKLTRSRVSKVSVVTQANGDLPAQVVTRRLTEPDYQPGVYGTVGRVETAQSGATGEQMAEAADAFLAEGGGTRELTMLPDPTLRAGMVARVEIEHADGAETVVGRVVSHTLKHSGEHTLTIQEA